MERTKYIPAITTLLGCLAATIFTFLNHYTPLKSMLVILAVLVVFYIAGLIIKALADRYLIVEVEKLDEEAQETEQEQTEEIQNNSAEENTTNT